MRKVFKKIAQVVDKVSEYLALIGSLAGLGLLFAGPYEVLMRYFFNSPTSWSGEINQFLLCAIISFCGGYVLLLGGHVRVDAVYQRFNLRQQAYASLFTYLFAIAFLIFLVWQVWQGALDSYLWNEHSGTSFNPPIYPVKFIIVLGAVNMLLQSIVQFFRYIKQAATGENQMVEKTEILETSMRSNQ